MRKSLQVVSIIAVLAGVGQLRMQSEHRLTKQLEAERILTPAFDFESRASLSQKGFIASFGSLRPTLAAVSALGIVQHHSRSDWPALEETVNEVVLLDPYNPYYWEMGGWHMAYNASASYQSDQSLPEIRRQKLCRKWIEKGSSFFDRGISANPQNLDLRLAKAQLWMSPYHIQDYSLAARTLEAALDEVEVSDARERRLRTRLFYALLRIPEQRQEAYDLGVNIFNQWPLRRSLSLRNGLAALQLDPKVSVEQEIGLHQLYEDRETAARNLRSYLEEGSMEKPRAGIRELIRRLESANPDNKRSR